MTRKYRRQGRSSSCNVTKNFYEGFAIFPCEILESRAFFCPRDQVPMDGTARVISDPRVLTRTIERSIFAAKVGGPVRNLISTVIKCDSHSGFCVTGARSGMQITGFAQKLSEIGKVLPRRWKNFKIFRNNTRD